MQERRALKASRGCRDPAALSVPRACPDRRARREAAASAEEEEEEETRNSAAETEFPYRGRPDPRDSWARWDLKVGVDWVAFFFEGATIPLFTELIVAKACHRQRCPPPHYCH